MTRLRKLSMAAAGLLVLAATSGFTSSAPAPAWRLSDTGVTARFRGLAPVSDRVAWVAGSGGTILRTVDGARTWQRVDPPGTADLQFRDIEAFDADHAVALTIGEGDQSRLYATSDGGRTWAETFRNDDPAAFYDCVTFLDRRHGLALSDPVGGKFRILATADGGRTWAVRPSTGMPAALAGEFAFAASGTCLVSADRAGSGRAWFATGGGERARVFATRDGGRTWRVTDSGIPSGPSAGVYSLAFRDPWHGIAVGGDYAVPETAPDAAATTRNGGRTWQSARTEPGEYRSGAAWLSSSTALAVGPTGSDISYNGGRTWREFDGGSFDAVLCAGKSCWASGEQGRVAPLTWKR
ncbi:WD40/YVTN/BNR-like repeat-containing protein [Symbioplanes lichenis]|uniref:WD40/YVTN/BNR-like repeat-containing protein n=1 Tax=Symbioplanes lichenis TaxID=1629072 RepID=UPI002738842D|nr:oxidoreductase [Actinoplanes lichenis]